MDNNYNPEAIEQSLYEHWEKAEFFKASDSGDGYCILILRPTLPAPCIWAMRSTKL